MVTQGSRIDQRKFSSGVSADTRVSMTLVSLCLIRGLEPKPVTRICS